MKILMNVVHTYSTLYWNSLETRHTKAFDPGLINIIDLAKM